MVRSTEFRIPMPLTLDEYHIAQTFMKTRMQMENTSGSEGVEVLASHPFKNEELGSGHFSHVMYHMQSKVPTWLRALAPAGALHMEEMSWNAFPHSKSVLKCPYFSKFLITIRSAYLEDRGTTENALHLSAEDLKERKVDLIDIAVHEKSMFTRLMAKSGIDPTKFRSEKLQRGPLKPGWIESSTPVMTAYKLVTVDAPYWGFGKRLETAVLSGERALFLEAHRKCFGWADEWATLSIEDVRRIEKENIESMRKSLVLRDKTPAPEFDESRSQSTFDGDHEAEEDGEETEKEEGERKEGKSNGENGVDSKSHS